MTTRFTIDGSAALEARLESLCASVRDGVVRLLPRRCLHALVLGGGYGRGEGGVLCTPSGEEPYNDLEFYILTRGSELLASALYRDRVRHLAEELTRKASLEIELKLLGFRKLQRSGPTMFYYDLVSGHRVLAGDANWSDRCEHHRAAHRIPLHEATRLLMNRLSGLLFSQERLARPDFSDEDRDFVGRNLAKAKLAFGDVVLAMRGQYHWSCRERHRRLKKIADEGGENLSSILLLHEQGVAFKLHPVRTGRAVEELRSELGFLKDVGRDLWLHLESRRLRRPFRTLAEYAADAGSKCPESGSLKNRLVNARSFGLAALANARYPREKLLRHLPVLLWEPASHQTARVREYESLWRNFN